MACLANMKQIAMATQCYAQDYDSRLPPAPTVVAAHTLAEGRPVGKDPGRYYSEQDWRRLLYPRYVPRWEIFVCPTKRSAYSYEFSPKLYGVSLRDAAPDAIMQYESGFVTGTPAGPHGGHYMVNECCGFTRGLPREALSGYSTAPSGRGAAPPSAGKDGGQ